MKVIPEMKRAHQIPFLSFYYYCTYYPDSVDNVI